MAMPKQRSFIIGLSGGSGSGKTFISTHLQKALNGEATILSYDRYYLDQSSLPPEERAKVNYDSPSTLDQAAFASDLAKLKSGESAEAPNYDFSTHSRTSEKTIVNPAKYTIAEGIMVLLLPKESFDFTIYVDADEEIRLQRRIKRDIVERGRTEESVIAQFKATVKPSHDLYVAPCKDKADFVFTNNSNDGIDQAQFELLVKAILEKKNDRR